MGVAPSLTRSSVLPFSLEMNLEIITREEARAAGLKHYFEGRPCKHGHLSRRNTRNSHCLACLLARANARKEADPDEYYRRVADLRRRRKESGKIDAKKEYRADPKRRKEISDAWRARNPDAARAKSQKRRAAKRGSKGSFSAKDIQMMMVLQRSMCATCRKSIKHERHIDHVIPLCKGGSNDKYNIQLLCPTCNTRKGGMDPLEWNQANGFLI